MMDSSATDGETDDRGAADVPAGDRSRITSLLLASSGGDPASLKELFELLHDELHRLAQARFRKERAGHTLQPTAVVNELYLRMVEGSRLEVRDRAHFLALAARAMRRLLVDYHRARSAEKRGGGRVRVSVVEAAGPEADVSEWDVEALESALETLSRLDERKARVVELRFYGGLGVD
jgi:RNA polymerase sigma factor (TIGR02999 family)